MRIVTRGDAEEEEFYGDLLEVAEFIRADSESPVS